MNSKQKLAFLLGVVAIAMMGLNPPWKEAGPKGLPMKYAPIYAPPVPVSPEKGMEIDTVRLLLQVGVAAILTGGLVAAGAPSPVPGAPASPSLPGQKPPSPQITIKSPGSDDEIEVDIDVDDSPNILRLPAGKSYGEFLVESDDDPDYWESLSAARGVVKLPHGKRIQLEVKGNQDVDLSFVTVMPPDALYSIDLSDSSVKDWELAHLQKLTELKELDLSSTNVSSQAFGYLKGLDKLEKLWLDGTAVDDSCLEQLKGFNSLKKLSLKETKITGDGIKELQERLTNCTVET